MPSLLKAVSLMIMLGIVFPSFAVAELNKCVDPISKKAFFTDSACPSGANREKSIATNAYSSQRFSSAEEGGSNPQVARLLNAKNLATKEYEKASSDYRFAKNNYTDQNAIQLAYNKLNYAEKSWANANQAYLNAVDPAQGANFQQQRNAVAIREQHEAAQESARQSAIRDEQRREQEATERDRLAQQVDQLRREQALATEAARRAETAANNAANNAAVNNRGPSHCYQKMNGAIYCN